MKTQVFKQSVGLVLTVLLLVAIPAPAFAADCNYTVGADSNETIVMALKSAATEDTVTLTGSGAITLSAADEIAAAVVLSPTGGGTSEITGGRFMGLVTVNCPTGSPGVTLEDGGYASLHTIGGEVNLKDSTVGRTVGTAVYMTGGSLVMTENAAVTTRDATAPAVSINGSIDKIDIGAGCSISAERTGIATGNGDNKAIGKITVSGWLQGGYRAAAFGAGTVLTTFCVLDGGSVFANGGAGVALENTGGVITELTIGQNASLTGTVTGVSNMTSSAYIYAMTVAGTLSGGSAGVSNLDGMITQIGVSGKILSDRTAVSNVRGSGATMIETILVQSGGQLWGRGISGVPGIGIANTGGVIGTIVASEGGYIEGGSSSTAEGYGIFNGYAAATSAHIETIIVRGGVAGMDGPVIGGIGIYNRAASIETMTVEETGSIHGTQAGIYNNFDQAPAQIQTFVNRGTIMSETNSLVNSPAGDAAKAVIGSTYFGVENDVSGSGSLLRGATVLGQIAGTPIEEIVPVVQPVFSSDYKTLTATCLKAMTPTDTIAGLRVQLFCIEDRFVRQIAVTDGNGQVRFSFAEPFSPQGKTFWLYTLAHYDEGNHVLYSSSKTELPAVPTVSGISASAANLPHVGGSVTLTVEGNNLTAASSLVVRSDTGITGAITPITLDTTNTATVSLPANTSTGAVKHTFTVWLNGTALPYTTNVTVQGLGGGLGGFVSLTVPTINANGSVLPAGRIDPLQPTDTLEVAPKDGSAYVIIPYPVLSGWNRQNSGFILEVRTDFASYLLPARLNELIPDLIERLKAKNIDAENTAFRVTLTDYSRNPAVSKALAQRFPGGKVLGAMVEFKVELLDQNGKIVSELNSFHAEIARRIFISGNMPASFGVFYFDADAQAFLFTPHHLMTSGEMRYVEIASKTNHVYAAVENTVTFTDVSNNFWAKAGIEQAAVKGLVSGVGGGLFEPNRAISRAEFVRLIINAVSPGPYQGEASTYSDVEKGDWHHGAVEKAAKLGFLPFVTGGRFRPNKAITREEMAAILAAVLKSEPSSMATINVKLRELFDDEQEMNRLYSEDIWLVYQTGVMIGTGEARFGFKESATRAEAVTVQLRLLRLLERMDS